jgi:5-methylcytosine-specific restriction endonuclease McrA
MKNFEAHGHACVVCKDFGPGRVTFDHIHTKAARRDLKYEPKNLMPLCFKCHLLKGQKGINYMADNFPDYKKWLINRGWEKDTFLGKWLLTQVESSNHPQ